MYPTSLVHLWCQEKDKGNGGDNGRGIQYYVKDLD